MSEKEIVRFLVPLQIIDVEVEINKSDDPDPIAHKALFDMLSKLRYEVGTPKDLQSSTPR